MSRPLAIDAFCGAGGASRGYYDAGFDIIGIDILNSKNYPYPFFRGDVFTLLPQLIASHKPVAIFASPPCQRYSSATREIHRESKPDLLEPTRELLKLSGLPYIIENVRLAPLEYPTMLCGSTFGLGVHAFGHWYENQRHRFFESNMPLANHGPCRHAGDRVAGVYGKPGGFSEKLNEPLLSGAHWQEAMGIDWMSTREITQAVPPAYTRHLGAQMIKMIEVAA